MFLMSLVRLADDAVFRTTLQTDTFHATNSINVVFTTQNSTVAVHNFAGIQFEIQAE